MALPLYSRHSSGLAAVYADLENHATHQDSPLVGTPGSVTLRSNGGGTRFYVRQYYDYDRTKRDEYLVAESAPDSQQQVEDWKRRIAEAADAIASVRLLAREGYATLSPKQLAALAPIAKHGLFGAGALLVGGHAFGVIVNRLGIRTSGFATEDIDIARSAKLALARPLEIPFLDLLRESGIDFVTVPPLDPRTPSTKFKERGRSRFSFDMLVPAAGEESGIEEIPELKIHATSLPYLRYLLGETQVGAALSTHGVIGVRIPVPERFALHKMVVARLRTGRTEKSLKDQRQAAALIAALGELHPGALTDAYGRTPVSVRKHVRASFEAIKPSLAPHPQALEEMQRALGS